MREQPPQQQAGLAGPWAGWAGGKPVPARGVPASRSPGRWGAVGESWGLAAGFPCPYAPGYGNADTRALRGHSAGFLRVGEGSSFIFD